VGFFSQCVAGTFSQEELDILSNLEGKKMLILKHEETEWRLKSRALWIKGGDLNTRFFHKFANQRRIHNSIWDLKDDHGQVVSSQKDLGSTTLNHFKFVFNDPGCP